jgi:hypothetical protein
MLPFNRIQEVAEKHQAFSILYIFDFSKFEYLKPSSTLKNDMKIFHSAVASSPASFVLTQINECIKSNIPYVDQASLPVFTLSALEHLNISFRYARLKTMFQYMYSIYKHEWLSEISKLYGDCYKIARISNALFPKIMIGWKQKDIDNYINYIQTYVEAETEIDRIFLKEYDNLSE